MSDRVMGKYYYKKKYYKGSRDKYSVEQTVFDVQTPAGQTTSIDVVGGVNLQGMRKVKHLTISAVPHGADGWWWVLMYVPQGMSTPGINITSQQPMVEPNQFVMNCGCLDSEAGPVRISSPVSRNLNSGDKIVLLLYPIGSAITPGISGVVRYAITLN